MVVFSEGKSSEPDYIRGLKRLSHIADDTALKVELFPEQGVPLILVELAIDRIRDPEVDECWCVFDVEWPQNHPNLPRALELARSNKIRLAVSNPCFEVWLVMHFQDINGFNSTDDVERLSRRVDGRSGKAINASLYMPRRKDAVRRAEQLTARHRRDGTVFPHDNPSSGMAEFLRALEPGL